MTWGVVAGIDAVAAVAYLAIFWIIGSGMLAGGQWRTNRLGTATALLFLAAAVHHGVIFGVAVGGEHGGLGWPRFVADGLTALAGIHYLSLRGSYASVLRGAQMFEDMKVRERQALEINDNIVQGLTVAKYAMTMGSDEQSRQAIEDTLRHARMIITDLLGEDELHGLRPGDLRRDRAASVDTRGRTS